jgi:hypothetical protein
MGPTLIGLIITGSGLMLTGVGLIFAGWQLRASYKQLQISQRIAGGNFLLQFDEILFQQHNEVHKRLRPGGEWAGSKGGPTSQEDRVAVERYMGMFERIKVLVDDKLLDLDAVERFYGYRIQNIVANPVIFREKKLMRPEEWSKLDKDIQEEHPWRNFIELWNEIETHRQRRSVLKSG